MFPEAHADIPSKLKNFLKWVRSDTHQIIFSCMQKVILQDHFIFI